MPYRKSKGWGITKPPCGTPVNMGHPLALGLRAAYLFAEGAGPKAINSARNDGSNGAIQSPASSWSPGRGGPAWSGDGSSRYIDVGLLTPPATLNITGPLTILALVNPSALSGTAYSVIVDSNAGNSAGQWGMMLTHFGDNNIYLTYAGTSFAGSGGVLQTSKWQSVGVSRSGSSGSWTLNTWYQGLLNNTGSSSTDPSAQQGAAIGVFGNQNAAKFFQGLIEYIYVWGRSLSATEILSVHTQPYQIFPTPRRRIISGSAAVSSKLLLWRRRKGVAV